MTTTTPDRELAARRRQLELDDPATWQADDNDTNLWPTNWNKPLYTALGRNLDFIPEALRPYYKRTAAGDAEILDRIPDDFFGMSTDLDPNGPPITVTRREPAELLHVLATRRARTRQNVVKQERIAQRDYATHTCAACAVVDPGVAARSIGAWEN